MNCICRAITRVNCICRAITQMNCICRAITQMKCRAQEWSMWWNDKNTNVKTCNSNSQLLL